MRILLSIAKRFLPRHCLKKNHNHKVLELLIPWTTSKGLEGATVNRTFVLKSVRVKPFRIRIILGVVVESDLN